jgi:hypothetical protein
MNYFDDAVIQIPENDIIQIPEGVFPGDELCLRNTDGEELTITVPPGATPGTEARVIKERKACFKEEEGEEDAEDHDADNSLGEESWSMFWTDEAKEYSEDIWKPLQDELEKLVADYAINAECQEGKLYFNLDPLRNADQSIQRRPLHRWPILLSKKPFDPTALNLNPTQVLLVGETGIGKTTLLNYLKYPCIQKAGDKKFDIIQKTDGGTSDTKTATLLFSSDTEYEPNLHVGEGIMVSDLPGFSDTRPLQEIFANSKLPKWLLEICGTSNVAEIEGCQSKQWVDAINYARVTGALQLPLRCALLVIDGTNRRLQSNVIESVNFFCEMFGESVTAMLKLVVCKNCHHPEAKHAAGQFASLLEELIQRKFCLQSTPHLPVFFMDSRPNDALALLRGLAERDRLLDMIKECPLISIHHKSAHLRLPESINHARARLMADHGKDIMALVSQNTTQSKEYARLSNDIRVKLEEKSDKQATIGKTEYELSNKDVPTPVQIVHHVQFTKLAFFKSTYRKLQLHVPAEYMRHKAAFGGQCGDLYAQFYEPLQPGEPEYDENHNRRPRRLDATYDENKNPPEVTITIR